MIINRKIKYFFRQNVLFERGFCFLIETPPLRRPRGVDDLWCETHYEASREKTGMTLLTVINTHLYVVRAEPPEGFTGDHTE